MKCLDFDWQINEFMVYCRSTQLREKSMASYEQALRLFERWCAEELRIFTVDKVTEPVIRKYINDLQERGKYTFYVNDQSLPRTQKGLSQTCQRCHHQQLHSQSACVLQLARKGLHHQKEPHAKDQTVKVQQTGQSVLV